MNPLILLLLKYGHLLFPFGKSRGFIKPLSELTLDDDFVREALASFQAFHRNNLEPLVAAFEPRKSPVVRMDGVLDPPTERLLTSARCDCPDYTVGLGTEMAVGGGNWRECNGASGFHRATIRITTPIPAFLQPVWDEVWRQVCDSYAEIGLDLVRDDNAARPQIDMSFVRPDGGWIGLAIVGYNVRCSDTIWARFDQGYKPPNLVSEWTTLIKHELGHNCGLQHSSGGVMNPYIVAGLPVSWRGDPSHPLLVERFGGERVPTSTPVERELVLAWRDKRTGQFELASTLPDQTGAWPT